MSISNITVFKDGTDNVFGGKQEKDGGPKRDPRTTICRFLIEENNSSEDLVKESRTSFLV